MMHCKVPVNMNEIAFAYAGNGAGASRNCLSNMHSHMLQQDAICCTLSGAKPQLVCPTTACWQFMQSTWSAEGGQ